MGRILLALLIWLSSSAFSWGQSNIMHFEAYPPSWESEKLMGDHAWRIYAAGEIDADAGRRLEALIAEKNIPTNSLLYLHSPGGNLLGGMELGRVIRKYLLNSSIGKLNITSKTEAGYCYSACALAFLGGEYRYLPAGSIYGVHRFFLEKRSSADADVAQIISAAIVEYVKSMGVDTKVFALASQAGSSQVVTPSKETLLALNVINNGRKTAEWTIESLAGVIYLKGQQETFIGMNKFLITCPARGPMELRAIYDAGQNTQEVMTWSTNWLFFDGNQKEIKNELIKKLVVNGWINLIYLFDSVLKKTISGAKNTVGVGLSPTAESVVFNGFDSMPFQGGAAKLPGFLQVCGRR
jgi:hypothetical protein